MTAARRFKLTPPEPSKTQIHEAVAQALAILVLPPCEWSCFPAGHARLPPAAAAALYRAGLKRGWPDFIVIHDGKVFGIELKTRTGRLSRTRTVRTKRGALRVIEGQEDVHPRLAMTGMRIAVCTSVDAVIDTLRGWQIPVLRCN
jgi:hypothetical protein